MTTCNDLLSNSSKHTLHLGDCRAVLATLDDASIDAIVYAVESPLMNL